MIQPFSKSGKFFVVLVALIFAVGAHSTAFALSKSKKHHKNHAKLKRASYHHRRHRFLRWNLARVATPAE
jgi:hypothetical protein